MMNVRAGYLLGLILTCTVVPLTAFAAHDSVVVPLRAKSLKIRSGSTELFTTVSVTVRNADVLPQSEVPGHTIRLIASDGDCPAGTVAGLPDFDSHTLD